MCSESVFVQRLLVSIYIFVFYVCREFVSAVSMFVCDLWCDMEYMYVCAGAG